MLELDMCDGNDFHMAERAECNSPAWFFIFFVIRIQFFGATCNLKLKCGVDHGYVAQHREWIDLDTFRSNDRQCNEAENMSHWFKHSTVEFNVVGNGMLFSISLLNLETDCSKKCGRCQRQFRLDYPLVAILPFAVLFSSFQTQKIQLKITLIPMECNRIASIG